MNDIATIRNQYDEFKSRNLNLNMTRGQPSDADFDLSLPLLDILDREDFITSNGVDIRNYPGGINGLAEARAIFSQQLGIAPSETMVANSSSLEVMTSILQWALLKGVKNSDGPWVTQSPKMIVTIPGYDRHFKMLEALGFGLVSVAITDEGPDIDAVEAAVAADSQIKGIFFVPTYSNPTGDTLSLSVAQRLVSMPTAATDFTIFGDDAYAIHHLDDDPGEIPNLLYEAKKAGKAERVILFGSTSKVTFAGAGLGLVGMSEDNLAYWGKILGLQTIGPNKVEQWRHVRFLESYPDGLFGLMRDHARIIKPKFDAVFKILDKGLGETGLASWKKPKGGYFISFDTTYPVADQVVALAADAGVAFTPAGATFPGGADPNNSNIRLAPTRPSLEDVEAAMQVFVSCVQLASAEYLSEHT